MTSHSMTMQKAIRMAEPAGQGSWNLVKTKIGTGPYYGRAGYHIQSICFRSNNYNWIDIPLDMAPYFSKLGAVFAEDFPWGQYEAPSLYHDLMELEHTYGLYTLGIRRILERQRLGAEVRFGGGSNGHYSAV